MFLAIRKSFRSILPSRFMSPGNRPERPPAFFPARLPAQPHAPRDPIFAFPFAIFRLIQECDRPYTRLAHSVVPAVMAATTTCDQYVPTTAMTAIGYMKMMPTTPIPAKLVTQSVSADIKSD